MLSFTKVNPIISATNLHKEVNLKGSKLVILDQISLEIKLGESVAIMGPSGAGKTTLLGLLAGLDLPTSGSVTLGGSFSAGYGLLPKESWVDLLDNKLQADKYDVVVVNASVSGATSTDGLASLPGLLEQYKPNILVLALGSNDGLRGGSLSLLRSTLGAIITKTEAADCKVLLVGFKLPPNYGIAYTNSFAEIFPKLSKEYKLPLVPFLLAGFEIKRELFQKDGLHPTSAAQEIMLQNVWPHLVPMLEASK